MKKYHLFAGTDYYPSFSMVDYRGSFDTVEDAMQRFAGLQSGQGIRNQFDSIDWGQIAKTEDSGHLTLVLQHCEYRDAQRNYVSAAWHVPEVTQ